MARRERPKRNKKVEDGPEPKANNTPSYSKRLAEAFAAYDEFLSEVADEEFLDSAKERAAKFEISEFDLQSQIQVHAAELDYIGNIQARSEMNLELAKAEENEAKAEMEVAKDRVRLDSKSQVQEQKLNMDDHKAIVNTDARTNKAREHYEVCIRRRIKANMVNMAIEADLRACKGREKMLQVLGMKWQFSEEQEDD